MPQTPFEWECPFCGRATTITSSKYSVDRHQFHPYNPGRFLHTEMIACPGSECRGIAVSVKLWESPEPNSVGTELGTWQLVPASNAKVFPDYVPAPIRQDYTEACAIQLLSPKASATLSRRALQGMIRDFWSVPRLRNLKLEIEAIQEKVDSSTWDAIDSVRTIGNIGAHMEADIDIIVDVDPEEAGLLLWLIERLVLDWYVAKHERENTLKQIKALAEAKNEAKSAPKNGHPAPEK